MLIVVGSYSPTGPPGFQNVGTTTIMANATVPFLAAARDDMPLPSFDNPTAYGFNILLLSNTSAAALDGPHPSRVDEIQQELSLDEVLILTAEVRATVVCYNSTAETHRHDASFWGKYYHTGDELKSIQMLPKWWQYSFGVRAKGSPASNVPWEWDQSWIFAGTFAGMFAGDRGLADFQQRALGFDISRYPCQGTWRITRSSVDLLSGTCSDKPLPYQFQWFKNSFITAASENMFILSQYLGRFHPGSALSQWEIPTHVVSIASMFESYIAAAEGFVHLQPEGPIWNFWNLTTEVEFPYIETYIVNDTSYKEVPTIKATAPLYIVLFLQPILTIVAWLATMLLHDIPISKGFGLLSILAGVETDGLDILEGATLSGELEEPVRMTIDISGVESPSPRVFYVVSGKGMNGRLVRRRKYR
jgi:hypothetical protein